MDSQATDDRADGPPRGPLIAALVLAIAATGIVLAVAATRRTPDQQGAIPALPAPHAQSADCRALLDVLPRQLGDYQRAPSSPDGTTVWRAAGDSEPVVLRCGVDRPRGFIASAPLVAVDRVQWFEESHPPGGAGTWYAVDRPVYVALTLPVRSGPTPIQQLSDVIDHTMAAVPVSPAPVG